MIAFNFGCWFLYSKSPKFIANNKEAMTLKLSLFLFCFVNCKYLCYKNRIALVMRCLMIENKSIILVHKSTELFSFVNENNHRSERVPVRAHQPALITHTTPQGSHKILSIILFKIKTTFSKRGCKNECAHLQQD
ncbi:hypothetical protein BpHYR1_015794 [Brachionus plicatilis]|uniref:Uncharacterized protein n=1 Tax=Brachionus plicatilis TaxID=10195 RepID=A0A3M7T437_BRAPC|nr:hypothetical protein BpHYR1_015794 [Brachionus plicatilis]